MVEILAKMNWPGDFMNQIICGDCLEVMKYIPDECIDLTITSPIYNLGNDHHTNTKRHQAYNDCMPENQYQKWQIEVLNEIYRITKKYGSLFYNHKNRIKDGISIIPYEWLFDTKWLIKQEIVWWNGSHNFDSIRFYPQTERIYWLAKSKLTTLNNKNSFLDIWQIPPVGTKYKHTRQFPQKLVDIIISCFDDARIIFDPFVGSGTTIRAAKDFRRNYIGIDIEKKYCKMTEERLAQGVL